MHLIRVFLQINSKSSCMAYRPGVLGSNQRQPRQAGFLCIVATNYVDYYTKSPR